MVLDAIKLKMKKKKLYSNTAIYLLSCFLWGYVLEILILLCWYTLGEQISKGAVDNQS